MTTDQSLDHLVESAFDFLIAGAKEFKSTPKYSVLHFATAIELFLKARLLVQDWKLVVTGNAPALKEFFEGDFKSVNLGEAFKRLGNDVNTPLDKSIQDAFTKIATHRNKMVHFYHAAVTASPDKKLQEEIALEQYIAWTHLEALLTNDWKTIFAPYAEKIDQVRDVMKTHRAELTAVYNKLKPELEARRQRGEIITTCRACQFESFCYVQPSSLITNAECLVCREKSPIVSVRCDSCQAAWVPLTEELTSRCRTCSRVLTESEKVTIAEQHASEPFDPDGSDWLFGQSELPCGDSSCTGKVHLGMFVGYDLFCNSCHKCKDHKMVARFLQSLSPEEIESIQHLGYYFCNECRSEDTVIQVDSGCICLKCLETSGGLMDCEHCGTRGTSIDNHNKWVGCALCGGEQELAAVHYPNE